MRHEQNSLPNPRDEEGEDQPADVRFLAESHESAKTESVEEPSAEDCPFVAAEFCYEVADHTGDWDDGEGESEEDCAAVYGRVQFDGQEVEVKKVGLGKEL